MTAINDADRVYKGSSRATNVFVGTNMVWPRISSLYAVFDAATAANVSIGGGGLNVRNTASGTTSSGARVATASAKTSGKFYYESLYNTSVFGGNIHLAGVATTGSTFADLNDWGNTGIMLNTSGQFWSLASVLGNIGNVAVGGRVGVAVDLDNYKFWGRHLPSGLWNNSAPANPATNTGGFTIPAGTMVPFVTFGGISTGPGNILKTNFGHFPFTGAVPSGFTAGWTV